VIQAKNGNIIFKNYKEFNNFCRKKIKPEVEENLEKKIQAEINKYHQSLEKAKELQTQQLISLLIPIVSTSLFNAYKFGEERQEPCLQQVVKNLKECTDEDIFSWDEYKEFCEKKGKKYFDVVEVENE